MPYLPVWALTPRPPNPCRRRGRAAGMSPSHRWALTFNSFHGTHSHKCAPLSTPFVPLRLPSAAARGVRRSVHPRQQPPALRRGLAGTLPGRPARRPHTRTRTSRRDRSSRRRRPRCRCHHHRVGRSFERRTHDISRRPHRGRGQVDPSPSAVPRGAGVPHRSRPRPRPRPQPRPRPRPGADPDQGHEHE